MSTFNERGHEISSDMPTPSNDDDSSHSFLLRVQICPCNACAKLFLSPTHPVAPPPCHLPCPCLRPAIARNNHPTHPQFPPLGGGVHEKTSENEEIESTEDKAGSS